MIVAVDSCWSWMVRTLRLWCPWTPYIKQAAARRVSPFGIVSWSVVVLGEFETQINLAQVQDHFGTRNGHVRIRNNTKLLNKLAESGHKISSLITCPVRIM